MSRGQQGIGISAAGMYGLLTTGKPVKIISKIGKGKPAHYYEIQIDTKRNQPEILNGRGEGVEIPPGERGRQAIEKHGIEWIEADHGTRVTIELEARYQRGRGSVDEYLEQTAIANPHVTLHYADPEGNERTFARVTEVLPPEPKEIKPHPYGVELGMLVTMLKETKAPTITQFSSRRSRGSAAAWPGGSATRPSSARRASTAADRPPRGRRALPGDPETKIPAPATDCISPIGEELILKGLHQVVPGEFYAAATRPPAVYRGNPFQIEVGLAYGGEPTAHRVPREALAELLGPERRPHAAPVPRHHLRRPGRRGRRPDPPRGQAAARACRRASSSDAEIDRLHEAMQNVNLHDGQTMTVLRYANRVPLQFQAGGLRDHADGHVDELAGLRADASRAARCPRGPVTVMVHMASVWVPFTSESKEAIAGYPEIQKELRLALQAVGRKLGMYLRRRQRVKHEGQRRDIFLRYLGEVADAVSDINQTRPRRSSTSGCWRWPSGRRPRPTCSWTTAAGAVEEDAEEFGENVLIVTAERTRHRTRNLSRLRTLRASSLNPDPLRRRRPQRPQRYP